MNSIRRTLLLWLSVGLLASIVIAAGLIYVQVQEEANVLFDYQMKQLVASLPGQSFVPLDAPHSNVLEVTSEQTDIVIQIWDNTGARLYQSHEHTELPQRAELGFVNVFANGSTWRVYSAQVGSTVVQISQPAEARRTLAAKMALKTVAPLLLLLPLLAGLIWVTVNRGLSPVRRIATDVLERNASSLNPISDANLPQEIKPLADALNDLLARLELSINAQRTFVADAAHELKTPLTALSLQIQLAERASSDAERADAFHDLKLGLSRANHLVHQLLTLARQEPGNSNVSKERIDLSALARNVVGDFAGLAVSRGIDLGLKADDKIMLNGNIDSLRILFNSLIDNAIRYSPDGATVNVSIEVNAKNINFIVEDNGPGIPDAELERVLDRFYRVPGTASDGSGLGLAIVKQIATAHGAVLMLTNRGHGLRACVTFGAV